MPDVTAHRLVSDLCVKMANEVYEELAYRDDFYKEYTDRDDFVRHLAPTLRVEARACLAALLNDPDTSDKQKRQIYEALTLDNALPRTGTSIVKKGAQA